MDIEKLKDLYRNTSSDQIHAGRCEDQWSEESIYQIETHDEYGRWTPQLSQYDAEFLVALHKAFPEMIKTMEAQTIEIKNLTSSNRVLGKLFDKSAAVIIESLGMLYAAGADTSLGIIPAIEHVINANKHNAQ